MAEEEQGLGDAIEEDAEPAAPSSSKLHCLLQLKDTGGNTMYQSVPLLQVLRSLMTRFHADCCTQAQTPYT